MNRGVRLLLFPLLGLVALVLGFIGYQIAYCPEPLDPWTGRLNNLWRAISLFFPGSGPEIVGPDNGYLVAARILAPVATLGAAYDLLRDRLLALWNSFCIALWRDHTVIIGHGYRGRSFLDSSARTDRVVVIDTSPKAAGGRETAPSSYGAKVRYLSGDGRDPGLLEAARVNHAKRVLILTGSDAVNLEILQRVRDVMHRGEGLADRVVTWLVRVRRRLSGDGESAAANVLVGVENRYLVRQLDRDDAFLGYLGGEQAQRLEALPFSYARTAAVAFLARHPLVDLALLRGQERVHVVCIGWTGFMFEFLEQLARLSPFREFAAPRVSLFVRSPKDVESEIAAIQPALLASAEQPVIALQMFDLDDDSGIPGSGMMRLVEPDGSATVTATVVSLGSDHDTVAAALAVRERALVQDRWKGPVFAHLAADGALPDLLEARASTPDLAARIVPVGMMRDACRLDAVMGARETMARRFHAAYLEAKGIDRSMPVERRHDNEMPWEDLKQTYRIASRRAIDHLAVKLLDAGYVITGSPWRTSARDPLAADDGVLDHLAELEHRSWEIDRRLEGWRSGAARDDDRRVNPALGVPFDKLDPDVKDYDRLPVRALASLLMQESGSATVLRDLRVGLIGHNHVTADERTRMRDRLDAALPGLLEDWRERHVSLLTPLAPGSDSILTGILIERLRKERIDHRLVVVRSLPREAMLRDFAGAERTDDVWGEAPRPEPHDDETASDILGIYMDAFLRDAGKRAVIADISDPGHDLAYWTADAAARERAYRRANAHIVQNCEVLIAFCREGHPQKPGGTAEALAWAEDTSAIPEEFAARGDKSVRPTVVRIT